MKALTLHQPWATCIAHHGKRVENRTWAPPQSIVGQRIAIHAGMKLDREVLGHKYCGDVCRNRAAGQRRTAEGRRRKGLRCTTTRSDVLRALRRGPWRTAREIHAALPERQPAPSFGSIATLLSGLVASGVVQHCGAKKNRRYALAGERRAMRPEARAA